MNQNGQQAAAPQLENVKDTALLVAACRAMETDRPDALIRDPFAARLAGEKGMALMSAMPAGKEFMSYGVGMRARFIDELLTRAIGEGVDTVLNLGAGLDTRPWRLDLPSDLRWIEVDFPAMLDYKVGVLAADKPHCHLDRASADLNNAAERRGVFQLASAESRKALLITEGLLMYLPAATLRSLAAETFADSPFRFWIFDVFSPQLMQLAHQGTFNLIERLRPETHIKGRDILNVVSETGWTALERRSMIPDPAVIGQSRIAELAQAIGRSGTPPMRPPDDGASGVWLYEAQR
ncbi:MAG: SAM-dependent methyltransferase [Acidobacteriaceae bacterium]|nr:SAM-dependent methyltransferase [Acidobacteriaceae bacterium]MBV9781047.1 SAM-dependent methyltransferase [Acidobacteriaceae bacterium]